MVDYDDLYDKITKNWPNVVDFINKDDIINKTKSREPSYNPKNNAKLGVSGPFPYFAQVMKSYIFKDVKDNQDRMKIINNRIEKLNQLGI